MQYKREEIFPAQIQQADSVDIVGFLQSQGEAVSKDRHEYVWNRHDSLRINPDKNVWFQHSTGRKGGMIRFLMTFSEDLGLDCSTFPKAVRYLIGESLPDIPVRKREPVPAAEQKKEFRLSVPCANNDHVVSYLQTVRKISPDVLTPFLAAGDVYEECRNGYYNCVFVGRDPAGVAQSATWRATEGVCRRDFPGSNKRYGFCHRTADSTDLFVFEAPIEVLSFATLFPAAMKHNLLSQGGCTNFGCTFQFLSDHPNIRRVFLGFNNDTDKKNNPGQSACEHLEQSLPAALTVCRVIPCQGDWNDVLRMDPQPEKLYTVRKRP